MSRIVKNLNGSVEWFAYDPWDRLIRHRTDGPAISHPDGGEEWYYNDRLHREDGPAVVWSNGTREWYFKGHLHREDGPAIEWTNGKREWYLRGLSVSELQHFLESPYYQNLPSDERVRKRLEII